MVRGEWVAGRRAWERLGAKTADEEAFAADEVRGRLRVRLAAPDEWFTPFGRRRALRMAEFLGKQRMSRAVKERPMVLADDGGILWVLGVRRSDRAAVRPDTTTALWVHIERHD